ncbi:MAG: hypothetical protein EON59_04385 [Alphaproteobacteria bacterium]|nr:MAG: hypothetical protein EON59_04385 [Alphaproteobacteria bacterium]
MVKAIGKPLTQAELDEGPEIVIAERLSHTFADLPAKHRPTDPELLSEIIGHVAGYPTDEYPDDVQSAYEMENIVVEKLAAVVKAAKSLRLSLLGSDEAALYRALSNRMPGGYSSHVDDYYVNLGRAIGWLCSTPALRTVAPPVGRKRKDPYAVQIAQAICWYLQHCETQEPTVGRTREGSSKSKAGVLVGVILQVLGIRLNGQLASVIETAVESGAWRDPGLGPWQLIPTVRNPKS